MKRRYAVTLALALAGCGDDAQVPIEPAHPPPPSPPAFQAIISDPATSTAPGQGTAGVQVTVAYVSLPRGTVPNGQSVTIENRRSGALVAGSVIEGGFDPIPIAAVVGDLLRLTIRLTDGGQLVASFTVPPGRRLLVLRTDPPPGKRDVPLNPDIVVAFSEPVDPATLNDGSILLRQNGALVGLRAEVVTGLPWMVLITPDAPLAPATAYQLVLGTGLRDLDGEGLESETVIEFTTVPMQPPTGPAEIAFVSTRDGGGPAAGYLAVPWIYLAAGDGSSARRLTQGEAPAWSPDGQRLAFHRWQSGVVGVGVVDLVVCNRDGSGQRVLAEGGFYPAWSPDGALIAYNTGVGAVGAGIYVVNALGTPVPRKLIDYSFALPDDGYGIGWVGFPDWSPDGQRLSFVRANYGIPWTVYLMNSDGSNPGQVPLSHTVGDSPPRWKPDGSRLLLQIPSWSIVTVALDGSDPRTHAVGAYLGDAVWSADGRAIAYTSFSGAATPDSPLGSRMRIYYSTLGSGTRRQLIPDALNPVNPDYWDTQPALWGVTEGGDGAGDWDYLRSRAKEGRQR